LGVYLKCSVFPMIIFVRRELARREGPSGGILENKYVFTFDHYKLALVYGTCRDGGKPRKNRHRMKKMLVAPVALFLTITLISMTMDVVGYAPGRQASAV